MKRDVERLLVVGLGSIGQRHARLARALLPNVRIAALRHGPTQEAVAGIERNFSTMAEALAFAPQAAVVANPANHHLGAARALVAAGVPTLIEKPLADRRDGVEQMLAVAKSKGVPVLTAYNLRFVPSLMHLREAVCEGLIGRVLSVRAEVGQYLPDWRPEMDYRQSVSARRALGGGALLELSHELDYLRWIFGEVDWVQAFTGRQSSLEIDVEDTVHLIMGFVSAGATPPPVATVTLDFVRRDTTRGCTVIGEQGTLRWNALAGSVDELIAGGAWRERFKHPPQRDESYLAQWKHFIACANRDESPLVTGDDGLAVLSVIEAVRIAAGNGSRTRVARSQTNPANQS